MTLRWIADPTTAQVQNLDTAANSVVAIPAGFSILQLIIKNKTANAVLGGLKIGTTAGGVDVAVAIAIAANQQQVVTDSLILKKIFSDTLDQNLYLQAVTSWNSANLDIKFILRKTT